MIATTQQALGDILADEAIERVRDHNILFVSTAVGWILRLKMERRPFTSDDVWALMQDVTMGEPRAMGAAFRKAQSLGWIKPTGNYVKSTRAACHGRPVREWITTNLPLGNGSDIGEAQG